MRGSGRSTRGSCTTRIGSAAMPLHRAGVKLARDAHERDPDPRFRGYAGEHIARAYTNLASALQTFERFDELDEVVAVALPYAIDHGFTAHAYSLQVRRC